MKRQLLKTVFASLVAVVGMSLVSSVQAQVERELFLKSFPDAQIQVDGNPSDWNLSEFGTYISGGMNTGLDHANWERVTGTGDIARLGWDDADEALFYGGMWSGAVLPDDKVDNSVKFYARHNSTTQYFLVEIADNEVNTGDEAAWANDSVEFFIDPQNDGDPTDFSSDVQLVIDAGNQVQVWNSPPEYEEQVEAGVTSNVTITATGWRLEVAIAKDVFEPALPAVLGPANGPAGSNYGIDFTYRDNDDPNDTGTRNGDPAYTTDYIWADPITTGSFPTKAASNWGEMIVGEPNVASGDFDDDGDVDGADFLKWQTGGSPAPLSGSDLTTWKTTYGLPAVVAGQPAPEPHSVVLAFVALSAFAALRRGRRAEIARL